MTVFVLVGGCGSDDDGPLRPENDAPIVHTQNDTTVAVGDTLHLHAVADDPDGDSLTYSCTVIGTLSDFKVCGFPDASIDSTDGHFEFRAKAIDQPNRVFRFSVDDRRAGRDSTTFTVTVE